MADTDTTPAPGAADNKPRAGALKSSLEVALHSHYAIRLWEGREPDKVPNSEGKKRAEIISMPKAIHRAGRIYADSEQDNPFADAAMVRLETALADASAVIQTEVAEIEKVISGVPAAITLTEVASVSPLNIGVFSRSPLGYRCVWLLVGFDNLALKTFQAHHYGLISRQRRDKLLEQGSHVVRKVYAVVQGYHSVSVSRQDLTDGTAASRVAISRFGIPDADILSGKRRSMFSPPLRQPKSAVSAPGISDVASDTAATGESPDGQEP